MDNSIKNNIIQFSHLDSYGKLIPVILITVWILYNKSMYIFALTPLGKLIAISLIVYYTMYDILHGLIMCGIILLYYQNLPDITLFKSSRDELLSYDQNRFERFSIISTNPATPEIGTREGGSIPDFKKNHCKNGIVMDKGYPVNPEMIEHIFSDINFKYEKCNPCSDTCDFSLIDTQINTEESLKPKTSDDFSLTKVLDKITGFIPALWVKSEPFTLL